MDLPETRYAWNGEISLAYQIVGDGPLDMIYLQGYSSHVDLNWESPHLARFLRGLSRGRRLIVMDRRGWGCSERFSPHDIPDVDELTDDVIAVMDAAGSERAVLFSSFECSLVTCLFAATYPERTAALILVDPFVTYARTDETPWMPTAEQWQEVDTLMRESWGRPSWVDAWPDGRERDWFLRFSRSSMTPGSLAAEVRRYLDADITAILPTIQAPALVCADRDGRFESRPETAHYMAERIPGARVVEHSSEGGIYRLHWYARGSAILEDVARFLDQLRREEESFDRVLATVLFTDIVGSTSRSAELGDRAWAELLERHHALTRTLLARFRGTEMDTAGDGFFVSFDGPARAVRCALAIIDAVRPLGLEVRAGLHTGEIERVDGKDGGIAVNIGARIAAMASPSETLVSHTVKDLVAGTDLAFDNRGSHELKGVPGEWLIFAVVPS